MKYFNGLNTEENYIIVPQAPSKYYLKNEYKYVGASWLTKENTATEVKNVLNYIDAVLEAENLPEDVNLILFGFSQGVSIASRWLASKKQIASWLRYTQVVFPTNLPLMILSLWITVPPI